MTPPFPPRPLPLLPILGREESYPVARIFCVGRNYAAHAAEMGDEVDREASFWFTKPRFAMILPEAPCPTRQAHRICTTRSSSWWRWARGAGPGPSPVAST